MKKIMICCIALTYFIALPVFALSDNLGLNEHTGNYLEATGGTNLYYVAALGSEGGMLGQGMQGFGWSAAFGHHITPLFSLEAGFAQAYFQLLSDDRDSNGKRKYEYDHINIPYVTTRFDVPIGERASFIAKIGGMYPRDTRGEGIVLPFVGLGMGYAITRNLTAEVQYQGAVYGIASAGLVSAGLSYNFG